MLINYQAALLKPCFVAGLNQLAEAAGYPVAGISQFKKTHHLIMESCEALYRSMLSAFMGREEGRQEWLSKVIDILNGIKDTPKEKFKDTMTDSIHTLFKKLFKFVQEMADKDDTWSQFVFEPVPVETGT